MCIRDSLGAATGRLLGQEPQPSRAGPCKPEVCVGLLRFAYLRKLRYQVCYRKPVGACQLQGFALNKKASMSRFGNCERHARYSP